MPNNHLFTIVAALVAIILIIIFYCFDKKIEQMACLLRTVDFLLFISIVKAGRLAL
jgi:hypothetical protein